MWSLSDFSSFTLFERNIDNWYLNWWIIFLNTSMRWKLLIVQKKAQWKYFLSEVAAVVNFLCICQETSYVYIDIYFIYDNIAYVTHTRVPKILGYFAGFSMPSFFLSSVVYHRSTQRFLVMQSIPFMYHHLFILLLVTNIWIVCDPLLLIQWSNKHLCTYVFGHMGVTLFWT